jgi:hypothetical protein
MYEVNVKLSPSLTKYHAMKTLWGKEIQLHAFLTAVLAGSGQIHVPAALSAEKAPPVNMT